MSFTPISTTIERNIEMLHKPRPSACCSVLAGQVTILTLAGFGLWLLQGAMVLPSVEADEARATVANQASSKLPTPQEQQALDDFHKLYRLDDKDQIIKFIKPPFVAGRAIDRKYRWKDRFGNGDHGTGGMFVYCYLFHDRDGNLDIPHNFAAGSRHTDTSLDGVELTTLVSMFVKVWDPDIDDPDKLLKRRLVGDWIIRADVTADKLLAPLAQVLSRECGVPIKLELGEVEQTVVAVRGTIKPPFVPKPDTIFELYAATLQPGKGEKDQGTFQEFLEDVGRFIEPNRRVVNEVENAPRGKIAWHRNVRIRFDDKSLKEDREPHSVLDHLEEQTGLKFALEPHKFRTVVVRRSVSRNLNIGQPLAVNRIRRQPAICPAAGGLSRRGSR